MTNVQIQGWDYFHKFYLILLCKYAYRFNVEHSFNMQNILNSKYIKKTKSEIQGDIYLKSDAN